MQSVIDKLKQLASDMMDRSHYSYLFVNELEDVIKELEGHAAQPPREGE